MVEEDLFFPGKCIDNEGSSIRTDDSSSITYWNSTSSDHRHACVNGFSTHDDEFDQGSPETPTTSTTPLPRTPSRSNSPAHGPRSVKKENEKEVAINEEQIPYDSFPPHSPQHRSLSRPLLSVQTEQFSGDTIPAGFGSSSVSLLGAIGTVNDTLMSRTRPSSVQTPNANGSKAGPSSSNSATSTSLGSEPKPTTKPTPFLLRMLTQTPTNPRDHTLLEIIWNEMLSSRWVNLSPLSLLTTYLEWHFKGVTFFHAHW